MCDVKNNYNVMIFKAGQYHEFHCHGLAGFIIVHLCLDTNMLIHLAHI